MKKARFLYRNAWLLIIGIIFTVGPAAVRAQELSAPEKQSLIIYSNNRALVNEQRTLKSQKGIFKVHLDDLSDKIDPSSVVIGFPGQVVGQVYQTRRTSISEVLKACIGHQIRFISETGQVEAGELVALEGNQAIIRSGKNDDYLVVNQIRNYTFILDKLPRKPMNKATITWTLKGSKNGSRPFDLAYQTNGVNWEARYNLILQNDRQADLKGWADISNQTDKDFTDAGITLVAGEIHQVRAPRPVYEYGNMAMKSTVAAGSVSQQSFSDYHLYQLPGRETLAAHSRQSIPIVAGDGIHVQKEYIYQQSYFTPAAQPGNGTIEVRYTVANTRGNHLGVPMPGGVISIYKKDPGGQLVLLGEDDIPHTPANDSLVVTQGKAFDITGSGLVADIRHISGKVTEQDVEVTLSNQKDSDVTVTVLRNLNGREQMMKSNIPYKKRSAYLYEFHVPVKAHRTTKLTYTIRQTNP